MPFGDEVILAHYSLASSTFEDRCIAGAAGDFDGIGIDPDVYLDARARGLSDKDLVGMLEDHDLRLPELETIVLAQFSDAASFRARLDDYWRVADVFGADHMSAIVIPGAELADQQEALSAVASQAREHGVRVGVEFIPQLTLVGDLDAAEAFVDGSGAPAETGIVFDVFHHRFSGSTWPRLEHLEVDRVVTVQLSDSPFPLSHDDYRLATTQERLPPGEGDLEIPAFVRALADLGCEAPCSVEVLNIGFEDLGPGEVGKILGHATRSVFGTGRQ